MSDRLTAVRRDVIRYLSRKDAKRHNILLLGKSGSGKSALLNTMIKAICGEYFPKAPVGHGATQSKTLNLIWYENCGVTEEDVCPCDEEEYDIRKLIPLLPHIFDAAGMGNVNSPELKEILELLLGGYIPPGTNIKALESIQTDNGVGYLRQTYTMAQTDWKITKIVFVQSGQNPVPKKLIECLHSIIRRTDYDIADQYTEDLFIVVTKEDLATADDKFQNIEDVDADGAQAASPREKFEAIVDELAHAFSIKGSVKHNLHRWTSYGDDVGYDSDEIDLQALKLLRKLVLPGRPRQAQIPKLSPWQQLQLKFWEFTRQRLDVQTSNGKVLAVIFIIIIAIIFWKLINSSY